MHIPTDDVLWVPPQPRVWRQPPAGRVLCLAPHPDDEAIGPGGALALHRAQGDAVRVVVATDGVAGDPEGRFAGHDYAALRRAESQRGLAVLGVDDVAFWGLPDSCVITDRDLDLVAARVQEEVARVSPDVVYLPWEGEGNGDHRALYAGGVRALRRIGFAGAVLGYEIWNAMVPDAILDVTAVAGQKEQALRCYATQLAYTDIVRPTLGLNAARSMIFANGHGFGEAYRAVRLAAGR